MVPCRSRQTLQVPAAPPQARAWARVKPGVEEAMQQAAYIVPPRTGRDSKSWSTGDVLRAASFSSSSSSDSGGSATDVDLSMMDFGLIRQSEDVNIPRLWDLSGRPAQTSAAKRRGARWQRRTGRDSTDDLLRAASFSS